MMSFGQNRDFGKKFKLVITLFRVGQFFDVAKNIYDYRSNTF